MTVRELIDVLGQHPPNADVEVVGGLISACLSRGRGWRSTRTERRCTLVGAMLPSGGTDIRT
jgi:hypothetical protein